MRALGWRAVFVVGAVSALLGTALGEPVASASTLLCAGLGIGGLLVGGRRWGTVYRAPWRLLAATIALFLVAAVVREVSGGVADLLDALGYASAIIAYHLLGRLRAHDRDPTSLLDALVVVGGIATLVWAFVMVPHVQTAAVAPGTKVVSVCFSILSLGLGLAVTRLAIGPGVKNGSYRLLALAAFGALGSDVLVSLGQASQTHLPMAVAGTTFLPQLAFVALGAAALHPTMRELTDRSTVSVAQMTTSRLAVMTFAVLVPPLTLLAKLRDPDVLLYGAGLIAGWALLMVLVMVRLSGLVRAREQLAAVERTLSRAAAGLVSATDREQMHEAAVTAVTELVGPGPNRLRVVLASRTDEGWTAVAARGHRSDEVLGTTLEPRNLRLPGDRTPVVRHGAAVDVADDGERTVVIAPLVSSNRLRGALICTLDGAVHPALVDGLGALAADLSLALETAALAEDLHRRRSEHRFRALVEHSTDLILVVDDEEGITFASPNAERLLSRCANQRSGMDLVHPDDRAVVRTVLAEARRDGMAHEPRRFRIVDADGAVAWYEFTASDLRHEPEVAGIVVNARDITERTRAEAARASSEARFRSLVRHSSDVLLVLDVDGRVSYASPSIEPVLGHDPDRLLTSRLEELVHPGDMPAVHEVLRVLPADAVPHRLELRIRMACGGWKTLEATLTDLRSDPDVAGVVLNAHDVTDRKSLEEDLRHKALHDDLTGLANRVLFRERVDHAVSTRLRPGVTMAVLFVDLDDFKTVNDGLGHGLGDELLQVVGARLDGMARAGDTAARLGGDEFALLLEDTDDVVGVAERVLAVLQEPVELEGRDIAVSASVGIALAGPDADSSELLLRNADVAMYYAKRTGKGRVRLFDETMYLDAFERLELKANLSHAVEDGSLRVHYQPLFALASGDLLGFEALVRWEHPERGLVSPASFIPIAEENGLIVPIGSWVLREALRQLTEWRTASGLDLHMSVNLSPRQLEEADVVEDVRDALLRSGVDPRTVSLELTESVVLEDGASRDHLVQLRQLGVGIAADDFGAGFASYAALQQLPFTTVKIDRSLISGLDTAPDKALPQVRSIVEMAHATGLHVVAEGIEHEAQRQTLADLGCDVGQGYLLGRPVPADQLDELLGIRTSQGAGSRS